MAMESNPETMNKYLQKLGVSDKWRLVDVIGLEGEPLSWIPKPTLAVILLFPLSDAYEEHRVAEESEMLKKSNEPLQDVFHLRQVVSNVCGTIALVHSVANNVQQIDLDDGILKKYLHDAQGLTAAAKGALLENTPAIFDVYKDIVSTTGNENENNEAITNHFITFIHKDGRLIELDGKKTTPIEHGETTPDKLLEDAARVCRSFIEREPNNIGFTVVALVPSV